MIHGPWTWGMIPGNSIVCKARADAWDWTWEAAIASLAAGEALELHLRHLMSECLRERHRKRTNVDADGSERKR